MPSIDLQPEILATLERIEAVLTALFNSTNKSGQYIMSVQPIRGGFCKHRVSLNSPCLQCAEEHV